MIALSSGLGVFTISAREEETKQTQGVENCCHPALLSVRKAGAGLPGFKKLKLIICYVNTCRLERQNIETQTEILGHRGDLEQFHCFYE